MVRTELVEETERERKLNDDRELTLRVTVRDATKIYHVVNASRGTSHGIGPIRCCSYSVLHRNDHVFGFSTALVFLLASTSSLIVKNALH